LGVAFRKIFRKFRQSWRNPLRLGTLGSLVFRGKSFVGQVCL